MKYSVAVHKETDSCYGATVPDIEGCYSAGDTLDEHLANEDYQGAIWCYVDVDTSAFLGKTEKATVTLPALLISKIDELVRDGAIKSRSAFLAESATKQLSSH